MSLMSEDVLVWWEDLAGCCCIQSIQVPGSLLPAGKAIHF